MDKINFQNLPNTTTAVNATNLNQVQTNVENEFNKIENYSSTEKIIGKWIDNSTLYRKVIEYGWDSAIGNSSGVTNISIPHNISSFRALTNLYATIQGRYSLPVMGNNNAASLISAVDNTNVNFRIINDTWGANTITIILEYVKN